MLHVVERPKGCERDDRHGHAGLNELPKDVPLHVDGCASIAVDGLSYRAHETDGKHANGQAQEGAEDDLLLKVDLDFPEEADGYCNDWGEKY